MTTGTPHIAFSVGEMRTGETYYCTVCGREHGKGHTQACRLYQQQLVENQRLRAKKRGKQ